MMKIMSLYFRGSVFPRYFLPLAYCARDELLSTNQAHKMPLRLTFSFLMSVIYKLADYTETSLTVSCIFQKCHVMNTIL